MIPAAQTVGSALPQTVVLSLEGQKQPLHLKLRRADLQNLSDAAFIIQLRQFIDAQNGLPVASEQKALDEAKSSSLQNFDFVIIGEQEGKSVAYILLSKAKLAGVETGYINQLGVVPEMQRQKVGLTSVTWVEQFCTKLGLPSISLNSTSFNEASLGFYRSLGWKLTSMTPRTPLIGYDLKWTKDLTCDA